MRIGCIEAGGTKFVCGISDELANIIERIEFPTNTPEETMKEVINYFQKHNVETIGLACFGPIDLNKQSKTYGYITSTPKKAWQNYDILGELKKHFTVPIGFDTDVNGAALGETYYGIAKGYQNVLYITIGTGIGAGALVEGNLVHGMLHPEMGHIIIKKHINDNFEGSCPYHKDCLEGLASGTAIEKRYQKVGQELTDNDEVWELIAYYIAQAIVNYILTLSPEIIILGGGVSKQKKLLQFIRKNVKDMLNGYIQTKEIDDINNYIVNPLLGDNAGFLGALALGLKAHNINKV